MFCVSMLLYQVAAARLLRDNDYLVGTDRDEYGCIHSAGYRWCQFTESCVSMNELCIPTYEDFSNDL